MRDFMSNKLDAERQISHVFSHLWDLKFFIDMKAYILWCTHTSIHMHIYDIWITLEQKGDQRREETRERRKEEESGHRRKKNVAVIKVHDTSERIVYITPNTEYYKNLPIKGKFQNKNWNAGKALSFSMCSALSPQQQVHGSSKDFTFLTCLLCHVVMNAPCTAEWGWKWKDFTKEVFYLLWAARRSPHQSYSAAHYYAADILLLIWNLGHRGPGKLAGQWGSMQIVISN